MEWLGALAGGWFVDGQEQAEGVGDDEPLAAPGFLARVETAGRPERSRLIYAIREYRGRKEEPEGFSRKDYRDLVIRARTQLGGPIVLAWDNLRMHLVAPLREFFGANADWLTVFQLPTYAPDLNPQKASGPWSNATSATLPPRTSARLPAL